MESFLRKKENLAKAAGRINILFSAFKSQPSYTRILLEDVMVHKNNTCRREDHSKSSY